ncbi:MAG TPA: response regulator transcription factor [Acidimicrobiales bacterium]|jgi:DNA-binding NarL/FixJ family response regulator|nr:response regulator transcription factor [Acidimicrobiales bacterium]
MTIRVLVVDDQALVRTGFRMILETQADIEVVGEAADGAAALELAGRLAPDLVLMDIRMPGMDGIAATQALTSPEGGTDRSASRGQGPRVIILTTYDLDEYVFEALQAGASGFLLKDVRPEDLIHGVRVVDGGDGLLAPAVTGRLIAEFCGRTREAPVVDPDPRLALLTPREREVLELMATGLSNAEIAGAAFVSENTVKTHVARIFDKLQLRGRAQAVIAAYEAGLVTPRSAGPRGGSGTQGAFPAGSPSPAATQANQA